jgi:hypothetical protein
MARKVTASHSHGEIPNPAIASPQTETARTTASPCRRILLVHPENIALTTAPMAIDAVKMPTVRAPPPYTFAASAGKSARGIAKIMAHMSARKVMSTFGRVRRKRRPSSTERGPAWRQRAAVPPAGPAPGGPPGSAVEADPPTGAGSRTGGIGGSRTSA